MVAANFFPKTHFFNQTCEFDQLLGDTSNKFDIHHFAFKGHIFRCRWCLMILRAKSILQWKFVLNVIYYSSCFFEYIERLVSSLLCKYWWLRTFGTHVFCSLFLRRLAEHTTHNSSILIHLSILEQKKLISWRSPSE